jgi:D-lactate dehydrogenase (cytochrome)
MHFAMQAAFQELTSLLGERATAADSIRALHGRDGLGFDEVVPDAVVFPESTDEVAAVMRICSAHRVPVIPFGAGSSVEGQVLAVQGGVSVDLTHMDAVLRISVDDLDATMQPGVTRMALEKRLGGEGVFFSVDPGADATLGGMAATGASGTNTVRYGTMRENVRALEVVLADGRVIRTGCRARKSSAGYDLTGLFVGSEGTLGIITELTVRLHPIPEAISAATCSFTATHDAVATAIAIVQDGVPIARCELLDATMMGAVNAHEETDYAVAPTLFFEFHGSPAGVEQDALAVAELARAHGGSDFRWAVHQEDRTRLWRARHNAAFAALGLRPGSRSIATDVCVPVAALADTIDAAIADAATLPFPAPLLGHVADGNFHMVLLLDPADPSHQTAADAMYGRLVDRALAADGTCTGEHGIGLGKRAKLVQEVGEETVNVMRELKHALDPHGLLNPGKVL